MAENLQSARSYNGALNTALPGVAVKGVTITTGGTALNATIPNNSLGNQPAFVRLAATAACYARLGKASEGSAVVATAGTGYVSGEVITLAGGTYVTPMTLTAATLKLLSTTMLTAGTGYVPADTITLAGGTAGTKAVLTVATTKVITATIVDGGTGGTPGAVTVTGTTGTGTPFQATGTIDAGGILTGPLVITVAGSYTVNPTNILIEPVTGGSLTGATVILTMGVATHTVSNAGSYSVTSTSFTQDSTSGLGVGFTSNAGVYGLLTVTLADGGSYSVIPSNPVSQSSTSGSGASADFTVTWNTLAAAGDMLIQPGDSVVINVVGFDFVSAIQVTGAGVLQISPIES